MEKSKNCKIQRKEITFNIQCKSYIAFVIITDNYNGVSEAQLRPDTDIITAKGATASP